MRLSTVPLKLIFVHSAHVPGCCVSLGLAAGQTVVCIALEHILFRHDPGLGLQIPRIKCAGLFAQYQSSEFQYGQARDKRQYKE